MSPRLGDQRGFTMIEAMIAVAIIGIIGSVVTNLLIGTFKFWTINLGNITSQRQMRAARDTLDRFVRQASASTVLLDQYSGANPPLSMISYVDAAGNSRAFFQKGNQFYVGTWTLVSGSRSVTAKQLLISNYLQRATFFYPDTKKPDTVSFILYSVWPIPRNVGTNIETQLSGNIEIRDP